MKNNDNVQSILADLGYTIEDDSWNGEDNRRTYSHDSDATAPYLRSLVLLFSPLGFKLDRNQVRALRSKDEIIELEPGGFDCPGHLLHHIKVRN